MKEKLSLKDKRNENNKDITVCFSGGIDSTYVSYVMGKEFGGRVHLMTLLHGYGSLFPKLCYRHVKDLKRLLGEDRIIHNFLHIKPLYKKILIDTLWQDLKKYKSMAIWCIGCHLAMHTHIVIYNLINQIPNVMLASSVGGKDYAPISLTVTAEQVKKFYGEYGINFSTPIIDNNIKKSNEKKLLRKKNVWPGLVIGKGTVGVQPICIPGFIQTWPDLFFNLHPYYDNNKVYKFIDEKKKIMKEYIENYFRENDLDLKEHIKN